MLDTTQYLLGAGSGVLVGFVLGLVGGGGSILAVPLMVYLVGVPSAHVAIGTSALAVAANALTGLLNHVRHGNVKWRCSLVYAAAGIAGAFAGSTAGKAFDGQKLLFLFAIVMVVVGVLMLRNRRREGDPSVVLGRENAPKLIGYGAGTGLFSGFFGIGGGFLITPALMWATDMPLSMAIGSSLVAVSAFGVTTAASYAASGLVDWPLAALFAVGGLLGGILGARLTVLLAARARALRTSFAAFVIAAGCYIAVQGIPALLRASSLA